MIYIDVQRFVLYMYDISKNEDLDELNEDSRVSFFLRSIMNINKVMQGQYDHVTQYLKPADISIFKNKLSQCNIKL
jgi:c-di-AMP phosphodiesterase-like protein